VIQIQYVNIRVKFEHRLSDSPFLCYCVILTKYSKESKVGKLYQAPSSEGSGSISSYILSSTVAEGEWSLSAPTLSAG
jgi:hypothetical protein